MIQLTIFTPTYNRCALLRVAYAALKRQTSKDFLWMIVDDGSTDETEAYVQSIQKEDCGFAVEYHKKPNGGLQTGYVEALKFIRTPLCMCVDSDDYLVDDGVEALLAFWKEHGSEEVAGVISLDRYPNGVLVGGKFPDDLKTINYRSIAPGKFGRTDSDVAMLYRTAAYDWTTPAKQYPNERSINASRQFLQIAMHQDLRILNRETVVVNYQADGVSNNKFRQYCKSPNSFADFRMFLLEMDGRRFRSYCRTAVHYVAECKLARRKVFVRDLKRKGFVVLSYLPGLLWYAWLKRNAVKTNCLDFTMEKAGKEPAQKQEEAR